MLNSQFFRKNITTWTSFLSAHKWPFFWKSDKIHFSCMKDKIVCNKIKFSSLLSELCTFHLRNLKLIWSSPGIWYALVICKFDFFKVKWTPEMRGEIIAQVYETLSLNFIGTFGQSQDFKTNQFKTHRETTQCLPRSNSFTA